MRSDFAPVPSDLRLNRSWGLTTIIASIVAIAVWLPAALAGDAQVVALATPPQSASASVQPSSGASDMTSEQCMRCHQVEPLFSHPIRITPTMNVPANLPLENGQLTCTTCHEASSREHRIARNTDTPMLRQTTQKSANLCMECHGPGSSDRAMNHALGLRRAHLSWTKSQSNDAASARSRAGFDAETQLCLSCHDGIVSSDVNMTRNNLSDSLSQHPVGISMQRMQSPLADENSMLKSPSHIDSRIRLFDNRVGCNSCHSPFSSERKLLVMSNQNSSLCLSCHTN